MLYSAHDLSMQEPSPFSKKLVAGTGLILTLAIGYMVVHQRPQDIRVAVRAEEYAAETGTGVTVGDILNTDNQPTAVPGQPATLQEMLYAPLPSETPTPTPSAQGYSQGLAEILYGLDPAKENVLPFGVEPSPSAPVGPYPVPLSRTFYYPGDLIRIFSGIPRSVVEIYWMDNADTAPEPSNVYAAEVGDDGSAAIEASTLPLGTFVFANTLPEAQCGGRYLRDCRLQPGYIGEFAVLIGSGSTIPGAPAYDPFASASPSPVPTP